MGKCSYCDSTDVAETILPGTSSTLGPAKRHPAVVCRECGRVSLDDPASPGVL